MSLLWLGSLSLAWPVRRRHGFRLFFQYGPDMDIVYGFTIAYWRESGSLNFLYGIYRKLRFSLLAAFGGLVGALTIRILSC